MIERRTVELSEIRVENKDKPVITGHAAVFNQKSEGLFGFREVIKPGAFARTIKTADVRALWNHDPNILLGRTKNNTLELSEDKTGLHVRIHPPDTIAANDVVETIRSGYVDQMSFGFKMVSQNWKTEDGEDVRELLDVDLFDVSPVTFAAYPQTDVQARGYFNIASQSESELRQYFEAQRQSFHKTEPKVNAELLKLYQERRQRLNRIY